MSRPNHEKAPPVGSDQAVAQDASLPVLDGAAGSDASDPLPEPTDVVVQSLLALVVRNYPDGGNSLEAAIRMAIHLGWGAGWASALLEDRA